MYLSTNLKIEISITKFNRNSGILFIDLRYPLISTKLVIYVTRRSCLLIDPLNFTSVCCMTSMLNASKCVTRVYNWVRRRTATFWCQVNKRCYPNSQYLNVSEGKTLLHNNYEVKLCDHSTKFGTHTENYLLNLIL